MKHLRRAWLGAASGLALAACGGKTTVLPGNDSVAGAGGSTGGASGSSTAAGGNATVAVGTSASSTVVGTAVSATSGPGGFGGTIDTSGTTGFGGTPGVGGATGVGGLGYCTPPYPSPMLPTSGLISDFENDSAVHAVPAGGVWADYNDGRGSTLLSFEPCGTSGKGMHFAGKGHNLWGADVAAALVSATQPVDVSAYRGLRFVMTSTINTAALVKIENPYSQPACGQCVDMLIGQECFSGYIKNLSIVRGSTTPIVIAWSDFFQQSWGYRPPGVQTFDPKNLISLAFAFDTNIDFDVCIDDVELVP